MRRLSLWLLAIAVLGGIGLSLAVRYGSVQDGPGAEPGSLRVEVLNGSDVPRLARAVADDLRRRRFEVHRTGNADSVHERTTLVERRATDGSNAARVAEFLGVQRQWWVFPVGSRQLPEVVIGLDSSRYLDVSVVVGRDYRQFFPGVVALR